MTLLRIDKGVDTGPVYGYFRYRYDPARESHVVIQHRVVLDNLDAIAGKLDFAVFMTGIGTTLILQEAAAAGRREELLRALAGMTVVSRGSKSTAALRKANIRIDLIPETAPWLSHFHPFLPGASRRGPDRFWR